MQAAKTRKIFDNRYEILAIVGRSKHSVVYHARHVMAPSTEVALKVLLSRKDMQSNADRLRKEALAMVSCRHRYVIRLDDFHSVGDLCYLSMEYAPESDLRKYVERSGGVLPPTQAQLFMSQASEALAFCHRAGITHRDIKQDNVLVVNDREVRLADFSVALLPGDESSLEELQRGVGSMDYMAPEVLEGRASEQRSDLYSLGVSFYELLSGKHPFSSAPLLQQLEIRKDGSFPPLSEAAPHVPKQLSDIVMKCLRYKIDDRPASAQEIIDQLAHGLPKMRNKQPAADDAVAATREQNASTSPASSSTATADAIEVATTTVPQTVPADAAAVAPTVSTATPPATPSESASASSSTASAKESRADEKHKRLATGPISTKYGRDGSSSKKQPSEFPFEHTPENALRPRVDRAAAEAVQPLSPVEMQASVAPTVTTPFVSGPTGSGVSGSGESETSQEPITTKERPSATARRVRSSAPPTAADEALAQQSSRAKTEQIDQGLIEQIRAHREKVAPAPTQKAKDLAVSKKAPSSPAAATPKPAAATPTKVKPGKRPQNLVLAALIGLLASAAVIIAISQLSPSDEPIAPQAYSVNEPIEDPTLVTEPLIFPRLAGGLYPGAIMGLIPNRELPLAILSLPDSERLIVIVGLEGWSPTVVDLSKLPQVAPGEETPIRLASNGFVLEFTGTSREGTIQGTFMNRVTREEGTWYIGRNRKQ